MDLGMELREQLEQLDEEIKALKKDIRDVGSIPESLASRGVLRRSVEHVMGETKYNLEVALKKKEEERQSVVRKAREDLAKMMGYPEEEHHHSTLADLPDRALVSHTETLLRVARFMP